MEGSVELQTAVRDHSESTVLRELKTVLNTAMATACPTGNSCWEINIAQKTCLMALPMDMLRIKS